MTDARTSCRTPMAKTRAAMRAACLQVDVSLVSVRWPSKSIVQVTPRTPLASPSSRRATRRRRRRRRFFVRSPAAMRWARTRVRPACASTTARTQQNVALLCVHTASTFNMTILDVSLSARRVLRPPLRRRKLPVRAAPRHRRRRRPVRRAPLSTATSLVRARAATPSACTAVRSPRSAWQ